jgi:hypothetical protein
MSFAPMHDVADADYLLCRAAAESEAAEAASACSSRRAHQRLASHYLDLLFGKREPACTRPELHSGDAVRHRREVLKVPFKMLKPVGRASDFGDLLVRLDA